MQSSSYLILINSSLCNLLVNPSSILKEINVWKVFNFVDAFSLGISIFLLFTSTFKSIPYDLATLMIDWTYGVNEKDSSTAFNVKSKSSNAITWFSLIYLEDYK